MEGKLLKFVGAATIGSAILISGPALAQRSSTSGESAKTQTAQASQGAPQSENASGGQSSSMEQRRDDDNKDWGWAGLLGLIGLADSAASATKTWAPEYCARLCVN
jgi:hypothetical protein